MKKNAIINTSGSGGRHDSLGIVFARSIEMHRDVPALGRTQQTDSPKQRSGITETGINITGIENRNDVIRFRASRNCREILGNEPVQDTSDRLFILAAKHIRPDRRNRYQAGGTPENG